MPQYISPSDSRYWESNPDRLAVPTGSVVGVDPNATPTPPTPPATPTPPSTPVVNRPIVSSPVDFAAQLEEDRKRIKREEVENARGRVEDINRQFEGIIRDETQAGEGRLGSTRSRGARAGLLGSSFGASQQAGTEKFNKQQQQFIQDQKTVQINAVFDKFDKRAEDRINQERLLSFATREEQIANRDAMIEEGRKNFAKLGESGQFPTLDLLDAEDLAEWSAQTGYSESMLRLINSENQPQENKIDWQEEIIGNTYLRTGYNPITGKVETIKIELPEGANGLEIIEGTPYNRTENADGTFTLEKAEGFEEKQPSVLDVIQQEAEITKLMKEIEQIGVTDPVEAEKKQLELELLQQKVNQKEEADNQVAIKAGNAFQVFDDKVSLIDELIAHPGLNNTVGTNIFGRLGFDPFNGESQDFIGKVRNLLGKETIDTLISLKARGGTLGALSDKERQLLEQSATAIGGWANEDKNRWNVKEETFIAELKKIKASTERVRDAAKADSANGNVGSTPDASFDSVWDDNA